MGASQTVSLTEFPYYFVKLQLSVYVPIDNVLGGLIAEDFHLDTLAAECKCSGVSLQVCARAGSFSRAFQPQCGIICVCVGLARILWLNVLHFQAKTASLNHVCPPFPSPFANSDNVCHVSIIIRVYLPFMCAESA